MNGGAGIQMIKKITNFMSFNTTGFSKARGIRKSGCNVKQKQSVVCFLPTA